MITIALTCNAFINSSVEVTTIDLFERMNEYNGLSFVAPVQICCCTLRFDEDSPFVDEFKLKKYFAEFHNSVNCI